MTAYHALAISPSDRNQLVKSAFPFGGLAGAAVGRHAAGGQPPQRNYFQRKFLDPAWNAAKPGVQQAVDSAWNAGRDGLKSMASDAQTAVDNGIDKGLNYVDKNLSQPMYGAMQSMQDGAKSLYAGAQTAVDSGIDKGLNYVDKNLSQPVNNAYYGALDSARGAVNQGIDKGLDFVNRNISAPMYGAMAGAQQGWQNANAPAGAPAQYAGHTPPRAEPVQSPAGPAPMQPPMPMQPASPQMMAGAPQVPPMDYNAQFRQMHGSNFDPNSSVDRAKMQQMQGGYASR